MANLNLSTVELVSTLRAAPQNGSPSSQDYNDSWTESLADLASLADFVNTILLPMLNGLDATIFPNPVAAPNGIEGRFIFGDTTDSSTLFFDSLSNEPNTIADSMRILQGINTNLQLAINTLTVTVTSLQSQLSATNQNDIAQALQNIATSVQNLTSQVVGNTQQISNAQAELGKQQAVRITTGSISASSSATVNVDFATSFGDNNYTFNLTLEDSSGFLSAKTIQKLSSGIGVSALVSNSDSGSPHTGTLHVIAFHD